MATASIVVSVVMKPLLSKLATLMGDKYKKLKGVRKQVSFLKDELTAMDAFLETLEMMGDDLDPSAKHWRSNVQEMAYDIEDCIDDFLHNLESTSGARESEGFVKRAARRLRNLRVRHRIANQIDELKARVLQAGDRRKRYKLFEHVHTSGPSSSVGVDPRVKAMYNEAANLVGIDGPREKHVKMLTDQAEQRQVISQSEAVEEAFLSPTKSLSQSPPVASAAAAATPKAKRIRELGIATATPKAKRVRELGTSFCNIDPELMTEENLSVKPNKIGAVGKPKAKKAKAKQDGEAAAPAVPGPKSKKDKK